MNARRVNHAVRRALRGKEFAGDEIERMVTWILEQSDPLRDVTWGALFGALQARGLTSEELLGVIRACRSFDSGFTIAREEVPDLNAPVVAVVGSGKDTVRTHNISTAAALLAAPMGTRVLKPVSASSYSKDGSGDLLDDFGFELPRRRGPLAALLRRHGIGFYRIEHAVPRFHARYGGRFLFFHPLSSFLGALTLPFSAEGMLVGLSHDWTREAVEFLDMLDMGCRTMMAVHCARDEGDLGCDELLPIGRNVATLRRQGHTVGVRLPAQPLSRDRRWEALDPGADPRAVSFMRLLMPGKALSLTQAAICLNAAAILYLDGRCRDLDHGQKLAAEALRAGLALERLEAIAADLVADPGHFGRLLDQATAS